MQEMKTGIVIAYMNDKYSDIKGEIEIMLSKIYRIIDKGCDYEDEIDKMLEDPFTTKHEREVLVGLKKSIDQALHKALDDYYV
ncbi:MAG: hypothetical protein WC346_21250 [Methanogenium sp.]|jgi:phosphoglycerate-specific signal transduction histidine kinase